MYYCLLFVIITTTRLAGKGLFPDRVFGRYDSIKEVLLSENATYTHTHTRTHTHLNDPRMTEVRHELARIPTLELNFSHGSLLHFFTLAKAFSGLSRVVRIRVLSSVVVKCRVVGIRVLSLALLCWGWVFVPRARHREWLPLPWSECNDRAGRKTFNAPNSRDWVLSLVRCNTLLSGSSLAIP